MGLDFEKPELGKPGWGQKVDANFEKVKNYAVGVDNSIANIANDLNSRANYNFIINGDMRISQRGNIFTGGSGYALDRYHFASNVLNDIRISQTSINLSQNTPNELCLEQINVKGVQTAFTDIRQYFEDKNVFASKKVTLSFEFKADAGFSISAFFESIEGLFTASPAYVGDGTVKKVVFTANIPSSGCTSVALHIGRENLDIGKKIYITSVKLEIGDKATPFVPRLPAEELALCQRYCYLPIKGYKDYEIPVAAIYNDGTMFSIDIAHPVTMRVPPKLITNIPSNMTKGRLVTTYNGSIQLIHQITPDANIQYTYSCDESRSAFRIIESQKPFTQEQCNYQISYDTIGLNPDYFIGFDAEI